MATTFEASGPGFDPQSEQRLDALHSEIDQIQNTLIGVQRELLEKSKPWYQQLPVWISLLAFALSVLSGFYSFTRDAEQDRNQARDALLTLTQKLNALPRQNFEVLEKYKDDTQARNFMSGLLTTEALGMINAAREIMDQHPDIVSDTSRYVVAQALMYTGKSLQGALLYSELLSSAKEPNVSLAAHREFAWYHYTIGQPDEGRRLYGEAISLFKRKFKTAVDDSYNSYSDLYTRIYWARAELLVRSCSSAKSQHDLAADLLERLALPVDSQEKKMLLEVAREIEACAS